MSNTTLDNEISNKPQDDTNLETNTQLNNEAQENINTPEYEEKQLNDTWILWYHDPNDLNWDISSFPGRIFSEQG